jgi:hypothetical protein
MGKQTKSRAKGGSIAGPGSSTIGVDVGDLKLKRGLPKRRLIGQGITNFFSCDRYIASTFPL